MDTSAAWKRVAGGWEGGNENIIIFQDFDFNKYLVYDYNTETVELRD